MHCGLNDLRCALLVHFQSYYTLKTEVCCAHCWCVHSAIIVSMHTPTVCIAHFSFYSVANFDIRFHRALTGPYTQGVALYPQNLCKSHTHLESRFVRKNPLQGCVLALPLVLVTKCFVFSIPVKSPHTHTVSRHECTHCMLLAKNCS
jgi:hypothetical protein